jgi:hypothetical protein
MLGPRVRLQRPLCIRGRERSVSRAGEDVEERVALRVDFPPAVRRERVAHETPVFGQDGRVLIPQLLDQSRRSLHVREQEGDVDDTGLGHRKLVKQPVSKQSVTKVCQSSRSS